MCTSVRRSLDDKDRGFTLTELLVVIIIIGILAAIAIPVFLNKRGKSVDASLRSDLRSAAIVVETWVADNPGQNMPNSAGWVTHTTGGQGGVLAGVEVSPGTYLWFRRSSSTSGGYCLTAHNTGASEATGSSFMAYVSIEGGLQSTLVTDDDCE